DLPGHCTIIEAIQAVPSPDQRSGDNGCYDKYRKHQWRYPPARDANQHQRNSDESCRRPASRQAAKELPSTMFDRDRLGMFPEQVIDHVCVGTGSRVERVSHPASQVSTSNTTNAATINFRHSFCWLSNSASWSRRFCSICFASSTSWVLSGTPSRSSPS